MNTIFPDVDSSDVACDNFVYNLSNMICTTYFNLDTSVFTDDVLPIKDLLICELNNRIQEGNQAVDNIIKRKSKNKIQDVMIEKIRMVRYQAMLKYIETKYDTQNEQPR